jgi:hypothetical protein
MLIRYICLITICLTAAAMAFAQGTFKPRDADEEQAWRLYNQYKESKRIEAPLEAEIKQLFGDAFEAAVGFGAILGVDWEANAAVKKKVEQLAIERKRQADLLAAWEKKFYWRYGDLRWSGETIRDAKTKREMDRIEFAMTYFPFNYVPRQASSLFDGQWLKTKRQHTDCSYSAESDLTISTDRAGVTKVISDVLGENKGKVVGGTLTLEYGIVNGVGTGKATFTLSEDGKSFTGTFSNKDGHRGNWSGKR